MQERFKQLLHIHWSLTLVLMCISVFIFSFSSYNLFFLLKANFRFIGEHGYLALTEGALKQLIELVGLSAVSAIFYIVFRACEQVLIKALLK